MNRRDFLAALAALPVLPALESAASPSAHVFGRLPRPGTIRRVYAAGPPAAVLAHALAPDALVGWPMAVPDEAKPFLAPSVREKPFVGRLSGRGSTIPLEKLLALTPDLVLDTGDVDETRLSAARDLHARTSLTYVLLPGRLLDSPWQLREAGRLLGVPARGETLAADAEARLDAADALRRRAGTKSPRVYLARGADGLETAFPGSVNAEALEAAGGVNVARGTTRGVGRISMEQLLAWAPEVVVTQDAGFHARARRDPLWLRLPALRSGRCFLAPGVPYGWLDGPPGVNRLVGVSWLVSRLHGLEGEDVAGNAMAFHRLYYGHAPDRSAFERLLRGA